MKSIKKFLFVVAALAAALAFVSCSSEESSGDVTVTLRPSNAVAEYEGVDDGITYTATFCNDKTFSVTAGLNGTWMLVMAGTYEGDPSKDGTVTVTVKKELGEDGEDLEDVPSKDQKPVPVVIKDGKCKFVNEWELTRK